MAKNPPRTWSKYRLKNRLVRENRWDEFQHLRDSIKPLIVDQGLKIGWAWVLASFAFPPLDGTPHEVARTEQIDQMLAETGVDSLLGVVVKLPSKPDQWPQDSDDFFLEGDPEASIEAIEPAAAKPVVPPADMEQGPLVIEPPPLPVSPRNNGWKIYERGLTAGVAAVTATAGEKRKAFDELFAEIDRRKRCKPYDMVQWVFEYAGINPAAISPEEVPSAGALKYLQLIQENPAAYAEFMKSLYAKTIPDKKQMEHEAKQRDDGRDQLRLLDAFDAEFNAA